MKIAIDARSLEENKTGVGRYLENILKCWKDQESTEFVLYFKDKLPQKDYLKSQNFALKKLENPLGFSSNFFFQHFLLPYILQKDKADFFFSPFYLRPLFCPVKSSITLHDISYETHPEWFDGKSQFFLRILSKISAKRTDVIFTVSQFSKSEITRYYDIPSDKIIVTMLAPDSDFHKVLDLQKIDEVKNKYGLSRYILDVGTIFTRRHVPEIVEAFDRFSDAYPDYQLAIIGKNKTYPFVDVDAMINEINSKSGRRSIIRLDYAGEDELMALYSGAEAVIYLSDYEGFGLPVVEGQFFDKPVITSRNSSLAEVGGESVQFVDNNNAEDILGSFNRVLRDKAYSDSLVSRGRENLKRFSWQECAGITLGEILRNV